MKISIARYAKRMNYLGAYVGCEGLPERFLVALKSLQISSADILCNPRYKPAISTAQETRCCNSNAVN